MATAMRIYTHDVSGTPAGDLAADVREGLSKAGQKELPSKYLYVEVGSALFEVICLLPEYGLSRAGARLLKRHAEEMIDRLPPPARDVLSDRHFAYRPFALLAGARPNRFGQR